MKKGKRNASSEIRALNKPIFHDTNHRHIVRTNRFIVFLPSSMFLYFTMIFYEMKMMTILRTNEKICFDFDKKKTQHVVASFSSNRNERYESVLLQRAIFASFVLVHLSPFSLHIGLEHTLLLSLTMHSFHRRMCR